MTLKAEYLQQSSYSARTDRAKGYIIYNKPGSIVICSPGYFFPKPSLSSPCLDPINNFY